MIGRHTHVRGAFTDQLERRCEHADRRRVRARVVVARHLAEVLPEQFVRSVDEVDEHRGSLCARMTPSDLTAAHRFLIVVTSDRRAVDLR